MTYLNKRLHCKWNLQRERRKVSLDLFLLNLYTGEKGGGVGREKFWCQNPESGIQINPHGNHVTVPELDPEIGEELHNRFHSIIATGLLSPKSPARVSFSCS